MPYIFIIVFLTLSLWVGHAALALLLGVVFSYLFRLSEDFFTKKIGTKILQTGIVFLGGSLSLSEAAKISGDFLPWVSLFVIATFFFAFLLGKLIGVDKKLSFLLASGSAICGGTAIAVVAPTIKSKPEELITALTIVFILNVIAVIIFPLIGSLLQLSQLQFGTFVALAIHDTASVIGAASIFGEEAVEVAATLKIGRTLWLIPLVLLSAWYFREKRSSFGFPLFIIFFIVALILNSILSPSYEVSYFLKQVNKTCLLVGLFCIGSQIDQRALLEITIKPLFQAIIIWLIVITSALWII